MVVKKSLYNKLVTKVNAIVNKVQSTSGLVSKKYYDSDKQNLHIKYQNKEILNTSGLIKKLLIIKNLQTLKIRYPAVRAKFTKIENKVPDITNLPAKAALKGT